MNSRFLCLLLSLGFSLPVCVHAQVEQEIDLNLLEELRTVAVEKWEAEELRLSSFQVHFVSETLQSTDSQSAKFKTLSKRDRFIAYDRRRNFKLSRIQIPGDNGISHDAENSRYRFNVYSENKSKQGQLLELQVTPAQGGGADVAKEFDSPSWSSNPNWVALHARIQLFWVPLKEIVSKPEFQPITVRLLKGPSRQIEFTAKYVGAKSKYRNPGGLYSFVVSPEENYRLEYGKVILPATSQFDYTDITNRYHVPDDVSTPAEVNRRLVSKKTIFNYRWVIDRPEPFSIAEEEFQLSHYGFSEQVLDTLSPNPWPRWLLIIAGVVSLIVGIWFIRYYDRTPSDR